MAGGSCCRVAWCARVMLLVLLVLQLIAVVEVVVVGVAVHAVLGACPTMDGGEPRMAGCLVVGVSPTPIPPKSCCWFAVTLWLAPAAAYGRVAELERQGWLLQVGDLV